MSLDDLYSEIDQLKQENYIFRGEINYLRDQISYIQRQILELNTSPSLVPLSSSITGNRRRRVNHPHSGTSFTTSSSPTILSSQNYNLNSNNSDGNDNGKLTNTSIEHSQPKVYTRYSNRSFPTNKVYDTEGYRSHLSSSSSSYTSSPPLQNNGYFRQLDFPPPY
jgi:hypothetical protein